MGINAMMGSVKRDMPRRKGRRSRNKNLLSYP